METEVKKTRQARKRYASKGERSQTMVTFRLDVDNKDWLNSQPNKGRYINNLIEKDRTSRETEP